MPKHTFFKKKERTIFRSTLLKVSAGALLAVTVILIVYFSSATSVFLGNIEENTKNLASAVTGARAEEIGALISKRLSEYETGTFSINSAASLKEAAGKLASYLESLKSAENTDGIVTARYFRDGKEYYAAAVDETFAYEKNESDLVLYLVENQLTGTTASVYEADSRADKCMAFCVQTPDCEFIDCVVFFVRMDVMFAGVSAFSGKGEQDFVLSGIFSGGGSVVRQKEHGDVFAQARNTNNLILMLNEATNDKETVNRLEQAVNRLATGSELLKIGGETYAAAFSPIPVTAGRLYAAEIYDPGAIFGGSYEFIAKLGGAVVMLAIIFTIMLSVIAAVRGYYKRQLYKSDNIDPVVGCRSFKKFHIDAEDLISINRTAAFAVLYFTVENHPHIKTAYGEDTAADVLRYIGKVLEKFITRSETYAYITENRFAVLIRYNTRDDIINRVKVFGALAYNFPSRELKKDGYNIKLRFGVYPVSRKDGADIRSILEKAMLAHKMKSYTDNNPYIFYEESMGAREERERAMEGRMEASLKNGDFKAFFQPKLNIQHDRLEGAEALARWYNAKENTYILPGEFIPLFETNGFITKLDRFMYEEVCRYFRDSMEQGYKVVPVSVNVSRITAMQPDFVPFYVSLKKKYNIADGYITIEFTESFAQENYEALRHIIRRLRSNGFKCSIDDFGSGYASYSILKELPMDELKLDQFFIKPGMDAKKDDALLSSIVRLATELGMKVTQEGVETRDEIVRLKALGCTVIQGFYYSKPITMHDYIGFVNSQPQKRPEI